MTTLDDPPRPDDPDGCDHHWTWHDRYGVFFCRRCGAWDDADGAA